MRLRSVHVSILVLLAILGTIAATSVAGVWATKGSGPGSAAGGRFGGQNGPADSLRALEGTPEGEVHEGETETPGVVKGRTTFADVLSWGLTREQVETVIGGPIPARATVIRDYAVEQGVSYGQYRGPLQALLDSLE